MNELDTLGIYLKPGEAFFTYLSREDISRITVPSARVAGDAIDIGGKELFPLALSRRDKEFYMSWLLDESRGLNPDSQESKKELADLRRELIGI